MNNVHLVVLLTVKTMNSLSDPNLPPYMALVMTLLSNPICRRHPFPSSVRIPVYDQHNFCLPNGALILEILHIYADKPSHSVYA